MAKVTTLGGTNTTASGETLALTALSVKSDYAKTRDDANVVEYSNTTAALDQEELLSYRWKTIPEVNTSLNIQNPAKVPGGVQYSVQMEFTATTTDSADADFRVDEPIVMYLTIRHPRSGNITETLVDTCLGRLVSSLYQNDGTSRIGDLMRSALEVVAD